MISIKNWDDFSSEEFADYWSARASSTHIAGKNYEAPNFDWCGYARLHLIADGELWSRGEIRKFGRWLATHNPSILVDVYDHARLARQYLANEDRTKRLSREQKRMLKSAKRWCAWLGSTIAVYWTVEDPETLENSAWQFYRMKLLSVVNRD